jgi:hypothetical protein
VYSIFSGVDVVIWIVFIALFAADNAKYFEMVDKQTKQGYTWNYVGRTELTNEIALPAKEQDGTLVYYWYLTEPK